MRQKRLYPAMLFVFVSVVFLLTGCVTKTEPGKKIRELEYTLLDEESIPKELKEKMTALKGEAYGLRFTDKGEIYVVKGYGSVPTTGYTAEVDGVYETEGGILFETTLKGPKKGAEIKQVSTAPYVAVKLEVIEKEVFFE